MSYDAQDTPFLPLNINGVKVVVTASVFACLGTIAIDLRFYVRFMKHAPILREDWIALLALVCTWPLPLGRPNSVFP